MKKLIAYFLFIIIPAIYWNPPALKFNVVTAAEKNVNDAALTTHGIMTQTLLTTSETFLNGMNRQLKSDAPVSDEIVRAHLTMYVQHSLGVLKGARLHLGEYVASMGRMPATERNDSKDLQRTRSDLDQAISLNQDLLDTLKANKSLSKDSLGTQLSKLRSQVSAAANDANGLRFKS